jgi:hypothetical protein
MTRNPAYDRGDEDNGVAPPHQPVLGGFPQYRPATHSSVDACTYCGAEVEIDLQGDGFVYYEPETLTRLRYHVLHVCSIQGEDARRSD